MTKHTFTVEPRQVVGRKVKHLRSKGLIPGTIFGKSVDSKNVQFPSKAFLSLLAEAGESTLVYLTLSGDKSEHPVLIRECVRHPLSNQIIHVTFNEVSLKEKVTANVPLKTEGESPADRDKLGILVQQLDEVEIEALPTDIPEAFVVDLSVLGTVDSAITVADLKVDASKITITTDPETVIVKVEPLAAEEAVESETPAEGEPVATEGESAAASETTAEPAKSE